MGQSTFNWAILYEYQVQDIDTQQEGKVLYFSCTWDELLLKIPWQEPVAIIRIGLEWH